MKISWLSRDETGRQGFRAQIGPYDALPAIDTFYMDDAPLLMNADRMAVAATLLFGRHISGPFELPKACSPAVASTIASVLQPLNVQVSPVDHAPRALPIGAGVCIAAEEDDDLAEPENLWGHRRQFLLRSLRSDHYSGSLAGMSSLTIATNGLLHVEPGSTGLARRLPSIAVAVLYAETLQIDEIVTPHAEEEGALGEVVRALLASVRLGFSSLTALAAL